MNAFVYLPTYNYRVVDTRVATTQRSFDFLEELFIPWGKKDHLLQCRQRHASKLVQKLLKMCQACVTRWLMQWLSWACCEKSLAPTKSNYSFRHQNSCCTYHAVDPCPKSLDNFLWRERLKLARKYSCSHGCVILQPFTSYQHDVRAYVQVFPSVKISTCADLPRSNVHIEFH